MYYISFWFFPNGVRVTLLGSMPKIPYLQTLVTSVKLMALHGPTGESYLRMKNVHIARLSFWFL